MKLVRHVRRTARALANPMGLPEELVLGGFLVGAIVGGAYLWRKYAPGGVVSSVTWTEITPAPAFQVGKTYRVTMTPIAGATSDDGAAGFEQFSDPAKGGGLIVVDPPYDASSWADADATRWHYQFISTENATPTNIPAGTRIWVLS